MELRGFEPAKHAFAIRNIYLPTKFHTHIVLKFDDSAGLEIEWSYGDSNPGPSRCQRDALAS